MSAKILIIEDSEDIRENTCELLELAGYETFAAENGLSGLELARSSKPDLILSDIMMPELDGYGVLRAIENIPELSGTPFVFLTAKAERSDFRNGMDLGADDYLTKPFTGDELLRVIGGRLKKGRIRKSDQANVDLSKAFNGTITSFEDLPLQSLNKTVKSFRTKDMIYMEGDTATHLYFMISGKVKTYKTNEWGKDYITQIVNPNEFFGHLALFNEGPHKQSAMAMESSEIAMIPRHSFLDLMASNRELAIKFIRLLSDHMEESEEKLLRLAYNSARKRVAEALLFIYRQYNDKDATGFSFPVNRENLSAIAGISPESVSRNLTDFREEKLISTEDGNIRILNFAGLTKLRG